MRASVANPDTHSSDTTSRVDSFFVPEGQRGLVIRNGIPEQYCPSGFHTLPPAPGKVEVRLLAPEACLKPVTAAPGLEAFAQPFERSLLFVDGALVGVLRASGRAHRSLRGWQGFHPARTLSVRTDEALQTCRVQSLRSCLPSAGVCCGGRVPSVV